MLSLILHLTANLAVLYQKYKAINGVKLKQLIFITQLRSVQKKPQQPKTKAETGEKKRLLLALLLQPWSEVSELTVQLSLANKERKTDPS